MNYFIDCGTHFFEGLSHFHNVYNFDTSWIIHSFEANPITFRKAANIIPTKIKATVNLMNTAVYTKNEYVVVHCDTFDGMGCGQGSNILTNPPDRDKVFHNQFKYNEYKVKAIDFVEFLNNLIDVERLIIKMDIEGSEFDVLQHMLNKTLIHPIEHMYVEFHDRFFDDMEKYAKLRHKLCHQLVDTNKVKILEEWR